MRHVIDAIAAQGRDGDTELLHVTKGEVAGLDALAKQHFGRELPRNPRTGIKEASLFQDWFGQGAGTVLGAIAPIAVGMIPGVGLPAAVAMGAATGAANQGFGKGGSTEGALLGGVMGGIGAYGGAGITESLTSAATAAPGTIAAPAAEGATSAAATAPGAAAPLTGTTYTSVPGMAGTTPALSSTGTASTASSLAPEISKAAFQSGVTGAAPTATSALAPEVSTTAFQQGASQTPMTAGDKMLSGWENVTKSPEAFGKFAGSNVGNAAKAVIGGYGSAVNMAQPEPIAVPGEEKKQQQKYRAEYYQGPGGEVRTRAVPMAQGGLAQFAGYDAAEIENDGYTPGGTITYAEGGVTSIPTDTKAGYSRAKTGPVLPEGFFSAEEYANATPEERATMEQLMQAEREFTPSPMRRTGAGYAMGGIASMAKGRYLQGPGGGLDDEIPATIDGKQPARLASGEFVVSSDVVSALGGGSSEDGARKLHDMMDRIRTQAHGTKKQVKRVNPKKVLPA